MGVELIRVDERLIHGQVVVGWGERLGLEWYLVVDDELADSDWEQRIYAQGLPDGVEASFVDVGTAAARLDELDAREAPGAVLLRTTSAARRLAEAGALEGRRVNLGCLPADERRREACSYVHLTPEEEEDVRATARLGAEVTARDVPTARPRPLDELVDALGR